VNRSARIRRSSRNDDFVGELCGLELRSVIGRPSRYRDAHFDAVADEHWNRSAALRADQP
jgi:hypothetical protein